MRIFKNEARLLHGYLENKKRKGECWNVGRTCARTYVRTTLFKGEQCVARESLQKEGVLEGEFNVRVHRESFNKHRVFTKQS